MFKIRNNDITIHTSEKEGHTDIIVLSKTWVTTIKMNIFIKNVKIYKIHKFSDVNNFYSICSMEKT